MLYIYLTDLQNFSPMIPCTLEIANGHCWTLTLADLGGGVRDARPPLGVQILSISCSFRENLACSRPPPRENPGSATAWYDHSGARDWAAVCQISVRWSRRCLFGNIRPNNLYRSDVVRQLMLRSKLKHQSLHRNGTWSIIILEIRLLRHVTPF